MFRSSNHRLARIFVPSCLALLAAAGCGSNPSTAPTSGNNSASVPQQKADKSLAAMLPASVKSAGKIVSVNSGSFPPYEIVGTNGSTRGASADMLKALGQMWGVKIEEKTVDGLDGELAGIASGRYQMAFGPIGDFKDREGSNDFVDYVQEFVVFAVPKGNPKHITGLDATCGDKIAVQAGGSAEDVIKGQAKKCAQQGKPKLTVMSFKDQPSSVLAVQSGRADAFFSSQAPLTYFVKQSGGKLQLAGTGQKNGFSKLYQGAVVPKDSKWTPLLEKSLQKLFDNGTYQAIMKKWGLNANMIDKPGTNMAVS